jgi:hypothetical protein
MKARATPLQSPSADMDIQSEVSFTTEVKSRLSLHCFVQSRPTVGQTPQFASFHFS